MKMTVVAATCAGGTLIAAVIGVLLLGFVLMVAGCGEIPQDAAKPFAGKEETRSYAGKALDGRTETMNEYLITKDAKAEPVRAMAAAEAINPVPASK